MTAQAASLMLIKIGDGQDPENFNTIGGLQNVQLDIAHDYPQSNNLESGQWVSLNTSAGFSRVGISGEGVYTQSTGEAAILGHVLNHTPANYQFHFSNGNTIAGQFVITGYNRFGNSEEEELFEITLINHGAVSFSAS